MIKRIVSFVLQQPLFVMLGLALFVGGGLFAFKNLPVEAFPDASDTQVTVITLFPGRAAEEVEKQITIPLEVALSGIPNAVRVFSHTQFGLSFLIITFTDASSDYFARAQVIERLRDAELPDGVKPQLAALSSPIGEIYRYRVKGDQLTPMALREIEDWTMERELKKVPGVADVVSFGGAVRTYEVQPDLAKLREYRVTFAQVFAALQRSNANSGGGYVEHGAQQYLLRGLGLLRGAADIERIVIAENKGIPVLMRNVAKVTVGNVPPQGVAGQDGNDDIVYGLVLMRKGENPSVVLAALKSRIQTINGSMLPPGVEIVPFYDRSWLISKTLKTVFTNLLEGALLVTIVLVLFLGNFRAAAIVAAMIPLALLSTFLGLTFAGIPANLLSLGAMDFGIIVDGAVIVVEHIFSRLSHLPDKSSLKTRMDTVLNATVEVGRPTFFSMLIIIAAHVPIFTLQRHEGRIFAPMAFSVTSALIGSLILSLTLVPLLSFWLLRNRLPQSDNRLMRACTRAYVPVLRWALAHRRTVVLIAVGAFAASMALVPKLGTEFLPELDEGAVWLSVLLDPTVSVSEAKKLARRIRGIVHEAPEVNTVITKLGRPEDGTDPKGANQIEALVDLKPEDQWTRKITKREILSELEGRLGVIPGVQVSFSQPIRDNVLESISQVKGQIVVKVVGDDLARINQYGREVFKQIQSIPGVTSAFIDREGELPQFQIDIDRDAAARYGLNVADIEDVLETTLAGKEATTIWEGERRFSVIARLNESEREVARIPSIPVPIGGNAFVPLEQLVHFRSTSGAVNIARENGQRVVSIGVFIKDRDMGSVVADMKTRVAETVKLDAGYRLAWSGEFENQERAMSRLAWVVPISILLIFVLLFDAFKSLKSAVLIIANIPLAMIGGIVALYVTGIPLSVSAAIGFIALFGQAVLNGVVMLTYFGQLTQQGRSIDEAVFEGSIGRLRTVLMTTLLAMLGLLPMALSTAIGAETQKPLATVVIGGLISATLLTLVLLPTMYAWLGRGSRRANDSDQISVEAAQKNSEA